MAARDSEMSFWDHLEVLRGTLFRSVLANRKRMGGLLRAASRLQGMLPSTKGVALGVSGDASHSQPVRHLPLLFSGIAGNRNFPS